MTVWYIGQILKSDFSSHFLLQKTDFYSAKQANSILFFACGKYYICIIYAQFPQNGHLEV